MNDLNKEKMLDLLIAQATVGLTDDEAKELKELEKTFPDLAGDDSFELAAVRFSMADLAQGEPMPAHLEAKILADADKYFVAEKIEEPEEYQKTFTVEAPRRAPLVQWLGWAFAGLAIAALGLNLWLTRTNPQVIREYVQVTPTPPPPADEQFKRMWMSGSGVVKTILADPKDPNQVVGDVVWSDAEQKGFIRLKGMPVNDKTREQYQLWIVAANQNAKTPVDGGVFDVDKNGEVIIPIDAKVKVEKPAAFAITAEKPGGVPVSDQGKVMAIGKVQA